MGLEILGGALFGAGLGVANSAIKTEAELSKANFNQKQAERNAEMQRQITRIQVETQKKETGAEIDQVRKHNQAIMAQNRAEAGSSGIDISGSTMLLAIDNAENAELEALEVQRTGRNKAKQLQYEGDVMAYNYELAAKEAQMEADFIEEQKKYIKAGGVFDAIGSGVSGAVKGGKAGAAVGGLLG